MSMTALSPMIAHASRAKGLDRKTIFMGRDYRVLSAVLVREQVLNNNLGASYLPGDKITDEWASMWNGIPVIAGDHPKARGQAISARTPSILNARGVGFIFNAKATTDATGTRQLQAEVWLDVERTKAVPELATILAKLNKGQIAELSTGFPANVEPAVGVFNGARYNLVLHPVGVDHLSIFASMTGACSVTDGCGLGVNRTAAKAAPARQAYMNPATPERPGTVVYGRPVASSERQEFAPPVSPYDRQTGR